MEIEQATINQTPTMPTCLVLLVTLEVPLPLTNVIDIHFKIKLSNPKF